MQKYKKIVSYSNWSFLKQFLMDSRNKILGDLIKRSFEKTILKFNFLSILTKMLILIFLQE